MIEMERSRKKEDVEGLEIHAVRLDSMLIWYNGDEDNYKGRGRASSNLHLIYSSTSHQLRQI